MPQAIKASKLETSSPLSWLIWGAGCCFMLTLCVFTWSFLTNETRFPVRHVGVKGEFKHIKSDVIEAELLKSMRGNFFTLNVAEIQQHMASLPWVETCLIRRVWPDMLNIALEEHQVIALWANEVGKNQYLTQNGQIIESPEPIHIQTLPIISAHEERAVMVGQVYQDVSLMLKAIDLQVKKLVLTDRLAWKIVLSNDLIVEIGRFELFTRLNRFIKAYESVIRVYNKSKVKKVDLRYPNGFAVQT